MTASREEIFERVKEVLTEQLEDRPFQQLERDVAGEAVGDDDVGGAPE